MREIFWGAGSGGGRGRNAGWGRMWLRYRIKTIVCVFVATHLCDEKLRTRPCLRVALRNIIVEW
jgi:hypothetical protein